SEGVVGRARSSGLVDVKARNLRDYTSDKHHVVDDMPFGGGPGMVMKPEPLFRAVDEITAERGAPDAVVLMTPQGRALSHAEVARFSLMSRLVVLCGRYEGIDERVTETLVTDEISIGDFVVTGGEIPALLLIDAVVRLMPGVVGDQGSVEGDSFVRGLLDHPHYTRPAVFRGLEVPGVLSSGHHGAIEQWRARQRVSRTWSRRPELLAMLEESSLSADEKDALAQVLSGAREKAEAKEQS
ncbi:MAG: tRNA (guanosine(37)-N1)-methyltransferase TrmD, partial [Vicinamibacterales bacterium]